MKIGHWNMAQRWRNFKRPASSKGMWKQFVEDNKWPIQQEQFKVGGLVEPGVTHYAKATVDDPAQGVKAGDDLGANIYQRKKDGYVLQMGSGDNRVTRHRKSLDEIKAYRDQVLSEGWKKRKTNYPKRGALENMFKDELFEQFFDAELKLTKGTKGGTGREEIKKVIAELPENATLKQKWDHLSTKDYKWRQSFLQPILRKFKGKYKRDAGYLSLQQLSDFTDFSKPTLTEAFFYSDKYKGVMPDVTKVSSAEYSKAKRGFEIVKQLEDIGITQQKIPGTYKASPTGKFKGKLALRLFNLPDDDQIIKLRNIPKLQGEEPTTVRGLISKASKKSPEYLKMEYGKDRGNMNKLLQALNASVKNLDEVELLKLIKNNPALEELVTSHFNSVAGEIQPVQLDDLTFKEIKDRIGFEKEHVRSFKTAKMDPVTKEVLDGLDIEYPKHLRISISGFNNPFKESAEKWVENNIKNINDPIIKGKIDKIDNFFTKFGQAYSIVDPTTNKRVIRGATESNLLKNIQALGFKEEMFEPELIANIKDRLQIAKTAKGPAKVKAIASMIAILGSGKLADEVLKKYGISLTQDENEKVLEASMFPGDLIKEHPVTSAAVAGTTLRASKSVKGDPLKKVRRLHRFVSTPLKKLIRSVGTPLAGAGFAGWQIHDNLKAGESVADAVVDPIVGAELAFPSLFKENLSKIIPDKYQGALAKAGRGALGLGKFGARFMGPIGWGITAAGLGKEAYKVLKEDKARRESITPEQRRRAQREDFDRDESMFAKGGIVSLLKK